MSDYARREAARILATSNDDRVKEVIAALIKSHDSDIDRSKNKVRKLESEISEIKGAEYSLSRKLSGVLRVLKYRFNQTQQDIVQLYLDSEIELGDMITSVREQSS